MRKRHNMLKSSRRRDWLLGDFMKPSAVPRALRRRKESYRKPSVPTSSKHLHWRKQPSGHQSFLPTVSICHRLSEGQAGLSPWSHPALTPVQPQLNTLLHLLPFRDLPLPSSFPLVNFCHPWARETAHICLSSPSPISLSP